VAERRLSVCLTFDFDALSPWVLELAAGNMAALSRGEFGAVAVPRILSLLERHGLPATFFVPGHTALAYPDIVRRIRDAGHEVGHHGFVHEPLSQLPREEEREILLRGLDALDRVAGVRRSATARRPST
jgi:peptidoglycan-N-acetylglucosamine deacetylase